MLHEEESLPRITTSCSDLDNILGGGISCRDVTEIGQPSPFCFASLVKSGRKQLVFNLNLNLGLFFSRWSTRDWQDSDWVKSVFFYFLIGFYSVINLSLISGSSSL